MRRELDKLNWDPSNGLGKKLLSIEARRGLSNGFRGEILEQIIFVQAAICFP